MNEHSDENPSHRDLAHATSDYAKEKQSRELLLRWFHEGNEHYKLHAGGTIVTFIATFVVPVTAKFANLPTWAASCAWVATLLVFASFSAWQTASSRALRLAQRLEPKLRVSCASHISNCKSINVWGDSRRKEWHSCLVESANDQSVGDVRATLERIEKDGKVLWDGPPHQLPFSPCGSIDSFSKTIRPGRREYFSVIVIDLDWNGEAIDRISIGAPTGWPHLPPLKDVFRAFGEFRLTVVVSGDETISEKIVLKFFSPANALETSSMSTV